MKIVHDITCALQFAHWSQNVMEPITTKKSFDN